MSYVLTFKNQAVDSVGKAPITVPVGTVNTTSTDLALTGKGAANYGTHQQNNLLRLLESFADTVAPANPTVGQLWYDASVFTLKVLVDKSPITWKSLGGVQVSATPPSPAAIGDVWFQPTGSGSGFMYVYTGLGRYPTTATTIGGWDQIYPNVEVFGGREEYDELRKLLNELAGESITTHGSGAIGRAIQNLTNFAALDLDLRTKYNALAADTNVLLSTASDISITQQAISTTAFLALDYGSAFDGSICGLSAGVPTVSAVPTIYVGTTLTAMPAAGLGLKFGGEEYFIVWDQTGGTIGQFYRQARFTDTGWEYDDNTNWVQFTPVSNCYIIGTVSSYEQENNNVFPGNKVGHMWAHAVPMTGIKIQHLKVEPNSNDWDALLACVKYALARLEVPYSFVKNVSDMPFVWDGRQVDSSFVSLPNTDARYPSANRRSGRKVGSVTMMQNFSETVNALRVGIENRFSMRGINGDTGTYPNFAPSVTTVTHAAPPTSGMSAVLSSGVGTFAFKIRFTNQSEMYRFLGSGGAVQFEFTHTGGALVTDSNFRTFLTTAGNWRFTADKTRLMDQTAPLTVTRQVGAIIGGVPRANAGMWNANDTTGQALTTQYLDQVGSSGPNIGVTLLRGASDNEITFTFNISSGAGAFAGTTACTVKVIRDTETFLPGPVAVYPGPLAFVAGDIVDPM